MGSEKRERQKAQRAARVEAAREAEKRAAKRRRLMIGGVLAAALVVVLGLIAIFSDDNGDSELAEDNDIGVAGEECVGLVDELPSEAPEFDAPEGDPPGELIVEDLVEGDGEEVAEGDTLFAHYVGVACSTGEIFDDSYTRGEPSELALDEVIEGWSTGLPGMREGGRRLLTIPPELAYGEDGHGAEIAPGETLTFVVDATEVVSN